MTNIDQLINLVSDIKRRKGLRPEGAWDVNDRHETHWQRSQGTSPPPRHRHIDPSHELHSSPPSFSSLHLALLLPWRRPPLALSCWRRHQLRQPARGSHLCFSGLVFHRGTGSTAPSFSPS